jgi:hypothetical protein
VYLPEVLRDYGRPKFEYLSEPFVRGRIFRTKSHVASSWLQQGPFRQELRDGRLGGFGPGIEAAARRDGEIFGLKVRHSLPFSMQIEQLPGTHSVPRAVHV